MTVFFLSLSYFSNSIQTDSWECFGLTVAQPIVYRSCWLFVGLKIYNLTGETLATLDFFCCFLIPACLDDCGCLFAGQLTTSIFHRSHYTRESRLLCCTKLHSHIPRLAGILKKSIFIVRNWKIKYWDEVLVPGTSSEIHARWSFPPLPGLSKLVANVVALFPFPIFCRVEAPLWQMHSLPFPSRGSNNAEVIVEALLCKKFKIIAFSHTIGQR